MPRNDHAIDTEARHLRVAEVICAAAANEKPMLFAALSLGEYLQPLPTDYLQVPLQFLSRGALSWSGCVREENGITIRAHRGIANIDFGRAFRRLLRREHTHLRRLPCRIATT